MSRSLGRKLRLEVLENRCLLAAAFDGIPAWIEVGPNRISQGTASEHQLRLFDKVGAVSAIAVHPTDPDVLYAATVNGGVWKTSNARMSRNDGLDNDGDGKYDLLDDDEVPTWQALTDNWPNLSMGAIAFDQSDSTYETLVAGNGRYSSLGREGTPRGGLLRTTDGGQTWSEIGRTTFQNRNVSSIAVDGSLLLVATSDGIWRNTTTGAGPWTQVRTGNATDLVADPANASGYFAAIVGAGIFRSTNDGQTWNPASNGVTGVAASAMIDLDAHAGGVYAAVSDNDSVTGVFRSTNSGGSWNAIGNIAAENIATRPASLMMAFAADPNDSDIVAVAGVTGNYFGDASANTWKRIVDQEANNTGSHADHRFFIYDQDGDFLDANDGGIYRLNRPHDENSRAYESINGNLGITEVNDRFSLAYDWLNNSIVVGTQDNGSATQDSPGKPRFSDQVGNDGNTVAVEVSGNTAYRYVMSNNYGAFERLQYNHKNQLQGTAQQVMLAASGSPNTHLSGLTRGDDSNYGRTGSYWPGFAFELNAITPSRVLLGTRNGLYESSNRGDVVADITPGNTDGLVTAAAYGGRSGGTANADVILAGARDELWLRTTSGGQFTQRTAYSGGRPYQIIFDPDDWHTAYVLDSSGRVWRGTQIGAGAEAWVNLTQGAGLSGLRSLEYVEIGGTEVLLAGGYDRLYRRLDPATGSHADSWSQFGRGLPGAAVRSVLYDAHDDLLLAGTLGRGVWAIEKAGSLLTQSSQLVVTGDLTDLGVSGAYQQFPNRDDVIRIAQNTERDDRLDIFINDAGDGPQYTVEAASIESVVINSRGGKDFIQVDYLPEHTELTINGGEDRDVIYIASSDVASDVNLFGDADPDWLVVTPTANAGVEITVDGSVPTAAASEGDGLLVLHGGAGFSINPGSSPDEGDVSVTGRNPVSYDNMEDVAAGALSWSPDRLESNDSFGAPTNLVSGDQTRTNLSVHASGNEDWYQWKATADGDLIVELFFDHELGDLDLELYSQSQTFLANSDSSTDNESLIYSVLKDFTYYIRVFGYQGATNPNYALELDWPHGFLDDRFEENDSFATATNLGQGDQTHKDLAITPISEFTSDDDWYRWTASETGALTVDAKFVDALGNLDLALYDSGQTLLTSATSVTDNEQLTQFVNGGDSYWIRVFATPGASHPDYELVVNGAEIAPDIFYNGKNNTPEKAKDLGAGEQTHTGLSIHQPLEDDWFRWRANAASPVTFGISFEHDLGDLDLELYDADLSLLRSSASTSDSEIVSFDAAAGQVFFVRVEGYDGATNFDYTLDVTWTPATPLDAYEPNDVFGQAYPLGIGDQRIEELTIHPVGEFQSNEDWYRWTASTDGLLDLSLSFLDAAGDVDLELYDAAENLLASSTSQVDYESLVWKVEAAQDYVVRVYGYQGARNADYDLEINGPDLLPDVLEINDAPARPIELGSGDQFFAGLTIHAPLNEDWYAWTAPGDGPLLAEVLFDHALGDVNVELYDEGFGQLDISNSVDDHEHVAAEVGAGQTVYLRVFGHDGATHPNYAMILDGPDIPPDRFESNDHWTDATELGLGSQFQAGLTIHEPGNSDWYRWTAPADGPLTLTALFPHALGDIDLELYDADQNLLASSLSRDDLEQVVVDVAANTAYYFRVFGASSTFVPRVLMEPKLTIDLGAVHSGYELLIEGPELAASADFDEDQDVDGRDFLAWQRGYPALGAVKSDGDADEDGDVDQDDLAIWQAQYGAQSAGNAQPIVGADLIDAALALHWMRDESADRQRPERDPHPLLELAEVSVYRWADLAEAAIDFPNVNDATAPTPQRDTTGATGRANEVLDQVFAESLVRRRIWR